MADPSGTDRPSGFDRETALRRLAGEEFDLLVVGGGVTGCGVALDAAARGLRTALVEAADFASGTSSRSSKLIHGGLRYLQQHDYRLVYEALAERQRLLRNAAHLVHPLPFLIPLFGKDGVVSEGLAKAYSTALWLYDITGGWRIGKRHRRIDQRTVLEHLPDLRVDHLVAGFLYWDAQADDARLTLALARTAALGFDAAVANYCPVASLVEDAEGRVRGALLADGTVVRARVVVDAGGVWAEEIAKLGIGADPGISIRPAKGIHLTVPAARLPCDFASVLSVPGDRRSIFVVPWDAAAGPSSLEGAEGRFVYLGTTDTDYEGPLDEPVCTPDDVDYILRTVNAWTSAGLTAADVTGSWAGLRPLIRGGDGHSRRRSRRQTARTADLSRRHRVMRSPSGLVTVTGGKLTTYRRMAADTVDEVVRSIASESRPRGRRFPSSPTKRLPLWGAGSPDAGLAASTGHPRSNGHPGSNGLPAETLGHLQRRYGSEAAVVASLVDDDPSLAEPLVPGLPYVKAEAVFAARHEMVVSLADVLSRRTRALILDAEACASAADDVARLVGAELGWTEARRRQGVDDFVAMVHEHRRAAGLPTAAVSTPR
ncbi:MAG: glycerol-3-phosphate dehydrogenase/oxidase [Acidimicrobiales bacterium]